MCRVYVDVEGLYTCLWCEVIVVQQFAGMFLSASDGTRKAEHAENRVHGYVSCAYVVMIYRANQFWNCIASPISPSTLTRSGHRIKDGARFMESYITKPIE